MWPRFPRARQICRDAHEVLESLHTAAMEPHGAPVLVDVQAVAEVHDPRPKPDAGGLRCQRITRQHVVAIDPGSKQPGTKLQPTIDRGALPVVTLADPGGKPRRILLDDLDGSVSATAIEDEVFEIWIPLEQD